MHRARGEAESCGARREAGDASPLLKYFIAWEVVEVSNLKNAINFANLILKILVFRQFSMISSYLLSIEEEKGLSK